MSPLPSCIARSAAALICQQREASAAIEELHAELPFQIRERLADDGLGAPQRRPAAEKLPSSAAG